jgi:hypothetical protein
MRPVSLRTIVFLGFVVTLTLGCNALPLNATATPVSGPPARALIVTGEAYPSDWEAILCDTHLCQNGDATYEQFFISKAHEPGQFLQEVFRYETTEAASAKYELYRKTDFHKSTFDLEGTEFAPPVELPYVSPIADEYYFACGREFGLVCRMVARYRNYFVYLYFDMDSGHGYGLTYTEVEHILKWLDEQAAEQLGLPTKSP